MNSPSSVPSTVLALNRGSSSIRFAVYEEDSMRCQLSGKIERIGLEGATMAVVDSAGKSLPSFAIPISHDEGATNFFINWLSEQSCFATIRAVGHRVVHGMKFHETMRITPGLLADLHRIVPYDPEHLPQELKLIEVFQDRFLDLTQLVCFDTSFHHNLPRRAKLLPIPRRYSEQGVVRYGFHGLSYAYLMEELSRLDPSAANGRVILAHLGNGASLAAVARGESIDTSMGFTPASGLVMGTRSGDLDPGLFRYLSRTEKMTATEFQTMVNKESGLLGLSETSADLRDLLAIEEIDSRAAEAVAVFCYQTKKWIGSFAAALGGLDTLVFAGGIGENSPVIRERICEGLKFLGIEIHGARNAEDSPIISSEQGRVRVRVIPTNEELMIARSCSRLG